MEYRVKKHLLISPIETFLTTDYPGYSAEMLKMFYQTGYYNYIQSTKNPKYQMIYKHIPEMKNLVKLIVNEHYEMTKKIDSNLNYLWYMYKSGTKAYQFKPFVFLAEIQLLKALDYVTEDEAYNMSNMMDSEDYDNINLVYLSILNMRKKRIEEHGDWLGDEVSDKFKEVVKNYTYTILSHELLVKTYKK